MTQEKKTQKTSIDDITPEQWDSLRAKETGRDHKFQVQWLDEEEEEEDNAPNDHPLFGDQNMVDNPPHYNNGSVECIEAIEAMLTKDEYIGYLRGNALKYMWRFRYKKKPFEDLRKARWYEERLMKFLLDNQDAV
ncbi:MAG: DUF3310 domain-containing protein [Rhodospirillales bacterium]|jgi:hypothetical protein